MSDQEEEISDSELNHDLLDKIDKMIEDVKSMKVDAVF